jgi:hypothetical protein
MPGRAAEMIRRKGAFLRSSRWSDLTLSSPGLTWSPQCQAGAQKAHVLSAISIYSKRISTCDYAVSGNSVTTASRGFRLMKMRSRVK